MSSALRFSYLVAALTLLAPVGATGLSAQASPEARTAREGVYTSAQATRGKRIYEQECALCHGPREFSGTAFLRRWSNMPLGSLFVHIKNTMPQTAPGMLSEAQTADVISYVLQLNGYPTGSAELPAVLDELTQIRFEQPSGAQQ
jgi:S-disulfanyl-L-cysteine oxidoreductase SoxD